MKKETENKDGEDDGTKGEGDKGTDWDQKG